MTDYTETLRQMPVEGREQIASCLKNRPYLKMVCATLVCSKSHTIHYGTQWKIELKSIMDIDALIEQLAKVI